MAEIKITGGELFRRHPRNPILSAEDWPYRVNSVFNAGAAIADGKTLLLVRAEDFRGISHLTAARSDDGIGGWKIDAQPTLMPEPENHPEEIWGIEDPRITYLEELGQWVIAYTAYSRGGPLVSLAMTKDFRNFNRLGPVTPPEDKDAAILPVRFGPPKAGWAMLHRPTPRMPGAAADIWISFSPDLTHWGEHQVVIPARQGGWWDANKVGLSAPPMRTCEGWLVLYHGVRTTASGSIYRLGLALLDLDRPARVIRRSAEWVFGPKVSYERDGDVDDVVFPCGWTEKDGTIFMYYGAADRYVALATAKLGDVVEYMRACPPE